MIRIDERGYRSSRGGTVRVCARLRRAETAGRRSTEPTAGRRIGVVGRRRRIWIHWFPTAVVVWHRRRRRGAAEVEVGAHRGEHLERPCALEDVIRRHERLMEDRQQAEAARQEPCDDTDDARRAADEE